MDERKRKRDRGMAQVQLAGHACSKKLQAARVHQWLRLTVQAQPPDQFGSHLTIGTPGLRRSRFRMLGIIGWVSLILARTAIRPMGGRSGVDQVDFSRREGGEGGTREILQRGTG